MPTRSKDLGAINHLLDRTLPDLVGELSKKEWLEFHDTLQKMYLRLAVVPKKTGKPKGNRRRLTTLFNEDWVAHYCKIDPIPKDKNAKAKWEGRFLKEAVKMDISEGSANAALKRLQDGECKDNPFL